MPPSVETVTALCLNKFQSLPKTGKPTAKEWTVLAGVVLYDEVNKHSRVVALGAGTKCIGQSKLCPKGLVLNDSHGEVLARRALLRYIYRQLERAIQNTDDSDNLFQWCHKRHVFIMREGKSFHFFSTQTPCGDACIVDNDGTYEAGDLEKEIPRKKLKLEDTESDCGSLLSDKIQTVYTGAKLISPGLTDVMHQTLGAVRIKPGRGDRTLSMSCSDKLSKWNLMGVQGALLDSLLDKPIYMDTFDFCCESDSESVKRAIYKRWRNRLFENQRFTPFEPQVRFCTSRSFEYQQDAERQQPSPNGLVWCDIEEHLKPYEISVNGKRQGVTAKKKHSPQSALRISKYYLLQEYINLLKNKNNLLEKFNLNEAQLDRLTYWEFKNLAHTYQESWSLAREKYFGQWTHKPQHLLEFCNDKVNKDNC